MPTAKPRAPQMSASQLMNKLKTKAKGAYKEARNVEPKARVGGFPPNLRGLVAACSNYRFAATSKGDPMFQLTGIVLDPEEYQGRRATKMWFINDTEWSTASENLEDFCNDLKLILGDSDVGYGPGELPDREEDLLTVLKELCEMGAVFLFDTGRERDKGSPNILITGKPDPTEWQDQPQEGRGEAGGRRRGNTPAASNGAADGTAGEENLDAGEVVDDAGTEAEPEAETTELDENWLPELKEEYYYLYKANQKATPKKVLLTIDKVDKRKKLIDGTIKELKKKVTGVTPAELLGE
jgi:hypothetical protein